MRSTFFSNSYYSSIYKWSIGWWSTAFLSLSSVIDEFCATSIMFPSMSAK